MPIQARSNCQTANWINLKFEAPTFVRESDDGIASDDGTGFWVQSNIFPGSNSIFYSNTLTFSENSPRSSVTINLTPFVIKKGSSDTNPRVAFQTSVSSTTPTGNLKNISKFTCPASDQSTFTSYTPPGSNFYYGTYSGVAMDFFITKSSFIVEKTVEEPSLQSIIVLLAAQATSVIAIFSVVHKKVGEYFKLYPGANGEELKPMLTNNVDDTSTTPNGTIESEARTDASKTSTSQENAPTPNSSSIELNPIVLVENNLFQSKQLSPTTSVPASIQPESPVQEAQLPSRQIQTSASTPSIPTLPPSLAGSRPTSVISSPQSQPPVISAAPVRPASVPSVTRQATTASISPPPQPPPPAGSPLVQDPSRFRRVVSTAQFRSSFSPTAAATAGNSLKPPAPPPPSVPRPGGRY
jgi:hypothetical protein